MGFIRGALVLVVLILLLVSLLSMNVLFVASSSLKYENVESSLKSFFNSQNFQSVAGDFAGSDINLTENEEKFLEEAEKYCENNSEYIFSYEGQNIVIDCDDVQQGTQGIINKTVENLTKQIYYKDYECDFWDCFEKEETPLFLISEKAKDYWTGKLYLALIISLVLIIGLFFSVKNKKNFPIILGGVIIFASLPLLAAESLISFPGGSVYGLLNSILTNLNLVFWASLVIGLALVGLGIAWKIWGLKFLDNLLNRKRVNN